MLHDLSRFTKTENNGYFCVYYPKHPRARVNGYVYLHRLVMENRLGRHLASHEIVHHKDGNRKNNADGNLELTTRKGHTHFHRGRLMPKHCPICRKSFQPAMSKSKYCSSECQHKAQRRTTWPSKSKLSGLLKKQTLQQIALHFGVSGGAVAKWCVQYDIQRPGRGRGRK